MALLAWRPDLADVADLMTYLELQNRALEALNLSTATTTDPRTRIKKAINDWQRRILTKPQFTRLLRDRQLTLTTTAAVHTYSLASSVKRINGITDTTNEIPLKRRDLTWLREQDPGLEIDGIPVAYVFLGSSSSSLLQVQLWPTPQAAYSYLVDYTAQLADMTADAEEPLLPEDFHHVLALGAQADEWRRMDDDRYVTLRQDIDIELRNMNAFLWDLADSTNEGRVGPRSRLGAWYPSDGSWR
jgi:hypothetical protein